MVKLATVFTYDLSVLGNLFRQRINRGDILAYLIGYGALLIGGGGYLVIHAVNGFNIRADFV